MICRDVTPVASQRVSGIDGIQDFGIFLVLIASNALGIGAASFWSAAEKDIAESPTALPERPDKVES